MRAPISNNTDGTPGGRAKQFDLQARQKSVGVVGELVGFLKANKKWWLIPLLVMLLVLGALIVLGGTGAAPLIYTLF